jgi:hypothetical protein
MIAKGSVPIVTKVDFDMPNLTMISQRLLAPAEKQSARLTGGYRTTFA